MEVTKLSAEETRESGFTHKAVISHEDCDAAATTQTFTLINDLTVGNIVRGAAFRLVEGFVGASVTNLTVHVGWNGATADDADGILEAVELATAGTEILAGDANGAAFATKRTGFAPQETTDIEAVITATGANVSALTAGEVHIYLQIADLSSL